MFPDPDGDPRTESLRYIVNRLAYCLRTGLRHSRMWASCADCPCRWCRIFVHACGAAIQADDRAACERYLRRCRRELAMARAAGLALGQ